MLSHLWFYLICHGQLMSIFSILKSYCVDINHDVAIAILMLVKGDGEPSGYPFNSYGWGWGKMSFKDKDKVFSSQWVWNGEECFRSRSTTICYYSSWTWLPRKAQWVCYIRHWWCRAGWFQNQEPRYWWKLYVWRNMGLSQMTSL